MHNKFIPTWCWWRWWFRVTCGSFRVLLVRRRKNQLEHVLLQTSFAWLLRRGFSNSVFLSRLLLLLMLLLLMLLLLSATRRTTQFFLSTHCLSILLSLSLPPHQSFDRLTSSFTSGKIRSLSYGANLLFGSLAWWPANSPNDRKIYNYQNKNYQNNQHTHTHTWLTSFRPEKTRLITHLPMMIMSHFMILVRDPHHPVPLARSLVRARVSTSLLILLLSCFSASLPLLLFRSNSIG